MTNQSDEAARESRDQQPEQQESSALEHDQDSEPTMSAPEEGRPDGLDALKGAGSEQGDKPE